MRPDDMDAMRPGDMDARSAGIPPANEAAEPALCGKAYSDLGYSGFDEGADCPVQWSLGLMREAAAHSCGKDVLCREAPAQLAAILGDISAGKGADGDIELCQELLGAMQASANCGMARDAAGKCLELTESHRDAWDQHISMRRCKALACMGLVTVYIAPALCTGCQKCSEACPSGAIAGGSGMIHVVDAGKCTRCLACQGVCPASAVAKATTGALIRAPEAPVPVGSFEGQAGDGRRRRRRPAGADGEECQ